MNDIKIGCGVKGMYKMQVLDHGRIVEDRPWAKNMILNQGIDYALSGIGGVGRLFVAHAVGTGTAAVVATDTALQNESKRSLSLVTGTGNTGRSYSSGVVTFRVTFDHSVEGAGGANYSEHGLAFNSVAPGNLFTRSLISGGTISVAEGQQLRVVYDISIALTPNVQTAAIVGGTGWPVSPATNCDGVVTFWDLDAVVGGFTTSGQPQYSNSLICMFGGGLPIVSACYSITLPSGVGESGGVSAISNSQISYTMSSYTTGSFTRTLNPSSYATAGSYSSTSIIGWSVYANYAMNPIVFKYNQAQTKASTHRLRYPSITVTWARA